MAGRLMEEAPGIGSRAVGSEEVHPWLVDLSLNVSLAKSQ